MFNYIVSDIEQYLELFNVVDLYKIELLEIEQFDHLTVRIYKMCLQFSGGARGVMVIVVVNGNGDTSSNPGPG